jgi:hypothetical protein
MGRITLLFAPDFAHSSPFNFPGFWPKGRVALKEMNPTTKTLIKCLVTGMFGLFGPDVGNAQGTITYLSNLGQTSAGSSPVGSDSWLAASFGTGSNAGGYLLNSVQLGMMNASGNPSGFTVMIYSASGHLDILPGSSLGTLAGSSDPAAGDIYNYTASPNFTLLPNTAYFIVLTDATTVAGGAYNWSYSSTFSYNPNGGWEAPLIFGAVFNYQSNDGSDWNLSGGYPQFAINATPAPEPGVISLFALGGLLVAFRRRKASLVE